MSVISFYRNLNHKQTAKLTKVFSSIHHLCVLWQKSGEKSMQSIAFIIRGEATLHLLPLTYYFLLSKNPVEFWLR